MGQIIDKMKNDLYWEHDQHGFCEFINECSECYKESLQEVREDYEEPIVDKYPDV